MYQTSGGGVMPMDVVRGDPQAHKKGYLVSKARGVLGDSCDKDGGMATMLGQWGYCFVRP